MSRPDADGHWPDANQARDAFLAERTAQRTHLVSAGLTTSEVDAVMEQIGRSPTLRPPPTPCCATETCTLATSSLTMTSRSAESSTGAYGTAAAESANSRDRHAVPTRRADTILTGYTVHDENQPVLTQRIALAAINQALGHIAWHQSVGNAGGTAQYVRARRFALARIS